MVRGPQGVFAKIPGLSVCLKALNRDEEGSNSAARTSTSTRPSVNRSRRRG